MPLSSALVLAIVALVSSSTVAGVGGIGQDINARDLHRMHPSQRQLQLGGGGEEDTMGCGMDINQDGVINVPDLLGLLTYFGCSGGSCCPRCDPNDDGRVNVIDVLTMLSWFNVRCEPIIEEPEPEPAGSIVANVVLDIALDSIPEGSDARAAFEAAFIADMTAALGVAHLAIRSVIDGGSIVVEFIVLCDADGSCMEPDALSAILGAGLSIAGATLTTDAVIVAEYPMPPEPEPEPEPEEPEPEPEEPPFAEAMNATAADTYAPLVAVSSAITFEGDDIGVVTDTELRVVFERGIAVALAAGLGDPGDGSAVDPEVVIVDEIRATDDDANAVDVLFHLLLPETLQLTGAAMVTTMQQSGLTIEVAVEAVNATFSADTASTEDPSVSPALVDCEGSWIASDDCSEPCGPDGARAQEFVVSRAEQNGGEDCADAEVLPATLPCNTHVQCPVDCSGEWGEWGECSLPCGSGNRTRNYVVLEEPQHGGAECPERDSSRSQECNTDPCPPPPPEPVDCVGSWSDYGECSHPCGESGLQLRTFTVSVVASNGGSACAADAGEVESSSCNTEIQCPIDCEGEWSDFGECSEVCGPGTRTRQFHITMAAQYGGACPEAGDGSVQSEDCNNLCPAGQSETDFASGPIALPVSGAFELSTLVRLPENATHLRGSAVSVARSYNGNEWEASMATNTPISFECTTAPLATCSTTLPAGATYQLRRYNGSALVSQDPKVFVSRFLAQATFGPTLDEIDRLSAATVEETEGALEGWLVRQLEMEPSLHRAYLRRRVNYQAYNDMSKIVRDPCMEASSWVTFAFSKYDQGKLVDVSLAADGASYELSVEGIVRTVVASMKDVREDIGYSCYKRGFRTPLNRATATVEVSVEACHERCVSTDGCAFFSFDEDNMECHLQRPGASGRQSGGPWRTGFADCAPHTHTYPAAEGMAEAVGLDNMGSLCFGGGRGCSHGPCANTSAYPRSFCGPNGYCCQYGRNINGCSSELIPTRTEDNGRPRCIPGPGHSLPLSDAPRLQANASYRICYVNEYESGVVSLLAPQDNPSIDWRQDACPFPATRQIIIGNPPVNLLEPDMFITQPLDSIAMVPMPIPLRDSFSLRNITERCELPPNPTVFIFHDGRYFRHEPREQLVDNTVDSPYIEDRMTVQTDTQVTGPMRRMGIATNFCPASVPNVMNREGCVRQNSCSQPVFSEGTVVLNETLIRDFFSKSQKYVYAVTDQSLDGFSDDEISPCSAQTRWKKTAGGACTPGDTPLDAATLASLSAHMANQAEVVLETADIIIIRPVQGECATAQLNSNVSIVGAKVTLNGTCYEQVHPDSHNVYDMAYWRQGGRGVNRGLGGVGPAGPTKLTRPAVDGETELVIGSVCADRSCWPPGSRNPVRLLGVLGQEVEFGSLPSSVQVPWLADFAGVTDVSADPLVSASCGSVGEVANDPAYGHKYADRTENPQKPTFGQTTMLWPNAVLNAQDHMRQRVVWALSQIYVVSSPGGYPGTITSITAYYDILVRNAFGSFRELIKEVAYSEPMSVMLTYRHSRSAAVTGDFADENFARELMQLFTIGLVQLNPDGTAVLDDDGAQIPTFGIKDIASFARTWTGFAPDSSGRYRRSNIVTADRAGARAVDSDPLIINARDRDAGPKLDLYDGYIGDGYPMCVDLPKRPFLRKGFKYHYRGARVVDLRNLQDSDGVAAIVTLENRSSSLFQVLCEPVEAACTFPTEVTLAQSLQCTGIECGLDRAPVVRVVDGSGTDAYYEAVEFPCTRFPFFNNGRFMTGASNKMICADPRSAAAAPLCCTDDSSGGTGSARCEYHLERTTFPTAASRCVQVCQGSTGVAGSESCHPVSRSRYTTWTGRPCSTRVQVQRDGRVNAVHAGELHAGVSRRRRTASETIADAISVGSKSLFDVVWGEAGGPQAAANCSSSCTVVEGDAGATCLCDVTASSSAVFTDSQRIPNASEVEALPLGALDPAAYDEGAYFRCTSALCNASDVRVWTNTSDELVFTEDTIFEVPIGDGGATKFFKNQELRVSVDGHSFRNPPTLIDFAYPTLRQAELETDAVLDHLTTHANTAPFIARKLIQLLTSSNPSPRYVLAVATAFRTGEYRGRVYSGEYGDLGATVAAIFLDREARDPTLDLDPAAGKIREPLMKVWHALRSLEFVANRGQEIEMPGVSQVGQRHHSAPSVFGFFSPDFVPAHPAFVKAALFAPEAELLDTPNIIGYMNGMAALVDGGLSGCGGGFGVRNVFAPNPHLSMPRLCGGGHQNQARKLTSDGVLTYEYQGRDGRDVVAELALLLTDGREPPAVRALWDESQTQYVNIALDRPTTSSSQSAGPIVDGHTDTGLFVSAECAGVQWVQVDLGRVTEIAKVKLYHRMDCCGQQINGATVLLSDTPDFTNGSVQCAAPLVFTGDPVGTLDCPGTSGRYVTLRQESAEGACLQAVELEVWAVRNDVVGEPTCEYVAPREVCYDVVAGGGASEASYCSPPEELHEVSCCADYAAPGFRQLSPETCPDVWGARDFSRAGGGAAGGCQHGLNNANAATWCMQHGGRLCTAQELGPMACTAATGCGHSGDLMWSSTEHVVVEVDDEFAVAGYDRHAQSCVDGHNIRLIGNQSIAECAALCDAEAACVGFEFERPPARTIAPADSYNVALGGTATQSDFRSGGRPARAIDGTHGDGTWRSRTCTHTRNSASSWWQVDLGDTFEIYDISVYHRTDCCADRLAGASIRVSATPNSDDGVECFASTGPSDQPEVGTCAGTTGQFITVLNSGIITICELEAMGVAPGSSDNGNGTSLNVTRDCQLSSGANMSGCDGAAHNLDFYTPSPMPGTQSANCAAVSLENDACAAAGCTYTPRLPLAIRVPPEAELLPDLIKLFTFSPEFTATNQNVLRDHPRPAQPDVPTRNRPYKAIVVFLLYGGADSWNMLVPHSGCIRDLYAEYAVIRGVAALPLADVLPIDLHANSTAQPCTTYGTHPALSFVKELWDAGQAAFYANIGSLTQPISRRDRLPTGLRSHTTQRQVIQSLKGKHSTQSDGNAYGSGVLGRVVEALTAQEDPYRSKIFTVYGNRKLIHGDSLPVILGRGGVQRFGQYSRYSATLQEMTGSESDSVFADVYSQQLESTLSNTNRLSGAMAAVTLQGSYSGSTGLEQVARVMSLGRDFHDSEREVFMVGIQSFDAHSGLGMPKLELLNADLAAFHTDLTRLNLWNVTAVTSISDFGRTIKTNGRGTDHAWSGNTFIVGGSVKGGHIHGHYPDDLNPATSELEVGGGSGIFIPTTPWEGLWYGLAQWFGVAEDRMAEVLPNAANFPDTALYSQDEVFNA